MSKTNDLDHVAIVVPDLEAAKAFAGSVLGLEFDREFEVAAAKRRVAFYHAGAARLEFIEDLDPERKASILGGKQAVIEHIAIRVGNLESRLGELGGLGVKLDGRGVVEIAGRHSGYTDPATTEGVMYQLIDSAG